MPEISVVFESLDAGAAGIRSTYTKLVGTLQTLERGLAPMTASWSGAAQESYLACKRQWDTAATELAAILGSIGRAVDEAGMNYANAESAARANWD